MIQFEKEQALITLKSSKIELFVVDDGEFNFKGDYNQVTLHKSKGTLYFPVDSDTFTPDIRTIKSVELFEA